MSYTDFPAKIIQYCSNQFNREKNLLTDGAGFTGKINYLLNSNLRQKADILARFILPSIDAVEAWGKIDCKNRSFVGTFYSLNDFVKTANTFLYCFHKWVVMKRVDENTPGGGIWRYLSLDKIAKITLKDLSSTLDLLSGYCATLTIINFTYQKKEHTTIDGKIIFASDDTVTSSEIMKPIRDQLYAAAVIIDLIDIVWKKTKEISTKKTESEEKSRKSSKIAKDQEEAIDQFLDFSLKVTMLASTILSGTVIKSIKHDGGCLMTSFAAGTIGVVQILREITKVSLK